MKHCELEVDFGKQEGEICGGNAHQHCTVCGIAICDRHTYLCCALMLCSSCLLEHEGKKQCA